MYDIVCVSQTYRWHEIIMCDWCDETVGSTGRIAKMIHMYAKRNLSSPRNQQMRRRNICRNENIRRAKWKNLTALTREKKKKLFSIIFLQSILARNCGLYLLAQTEPIIVSMWAELFVYLVKHIVTQWRYVIIAVLTIAYIVPPSLRLYFFFRLSGYIVNPHWSFCISILFPSFASLRCAVHNL